MSIYDALKSDHREVLALVAQAEKATGNRRRGLIEEIVDNLSAHAMAEEEVFYDTIAGSSDETEELTTEANEEHLSVARLMRDLLSSSLTDDRAKAKLMVLKEQLEHHIEEEEGELFSKAKRVLGSEVADALEGQFLAKKMELKGKPLDARVQQAIAKQEKLAGVSSSSSSSTSSMSGSVKKANGASSLHGASAR